MYRQKSADLSRLMGVPQSPISPKSQWVRCNTVSVLDKDCLTLLTQIFEVSTAMIDLTLAIFAA